MSSLMIEELEGLINKYSQENNSLPRNWGYYCQKCYDEGMELERELDYDH